MGNEGVSDRTCGMASGEMITVGGVEVKLKIFEPARADIYVDLKNIMIDSGAFKTPSVKLCAFLIGMETKL